MSGKGVIQFQVTNSEMLEKTMSRLGHKFEMKKTEPWKAVIRRPYNNIEISKDKVSFDTVDRQLVEQIQYEYQKDFQVFERTMRGETYDLVETTDEIVITVH